MGEKARERERDSADQDPKWDIALSVLAQDEPLGSELKGRLVEAGYSVFLYSHEQPELAGQDGESVFAETFRDDSRACVVLYRRPWGDTRWTAVEERSIRDRTTHQRPEDFLLVVNLEEDRPDLPWLPTYIIYHDYPTFGIEGASAAISQVARRAGSRPKPEAAGDMAERLARKRDWVKRRDALLRSSEGLQMLRDQKAALFRYIESTVKDLERDHGFGLRSKEAQNRGLLHLWGEGYTIGVSWEPATVDIRNVSGFYITVWNGYPMNYDREAERLREIMYRVSMTPDMKVRWKRENSTESALTTEDLGERIVKLLLEQIRTG